MHGILQSRSAVAPPQIPSMCVAQPVLYPHVSVVFFVFGGGALADTTPLLPYTQEPFCESERVFLRRN